MDERRLNAYARSFRVGDRILVGEHVGDVRTIRNEELSEGVEILSPGYQAIRDANAAVLPAEPAGTRPAPSGFRLLPPGS